MASQIQAMKAAFEKAAKQVFFKGSALEEIQRIAIETLENAEHEFEERLSKLHETANQRVAEISQQLEVKTLELKRTLENINVLEAKLKAVIEKSNKERKSAAARGNRYRAKFEHLLDDIEAVLPGAKELLTQKAISKQEKVERMTKLDRQINQQKKRVQSKTHYEPDSFRDVYLPGYGKQCRILQELLVRKKKLENRKSY